MARLGLLAGSGELPARIVAACRASGREVFVVAFKGQTDAATVAGVPHLWSRLGAAGEIIERLKAEGVRDLVMAGAIRRPSPLELMPDWRAAKFFSRIGMRALGDDGLLRAVAAELEGEGFRLLAPNAVLSELTAQSGPVGRLQPDEQGWADIRHGLRVAHELGRLDVGQAVVVQQGLVLAVEAIEGTDAMLGRCGALRRDGPGGVLVKACKPQQDRRLDLPTIGPTTVANAAAAGLRGIAIEAGAALVVDRAGTAEAADRLGLFVVGVAP